MSTILLVGLFLFVDDKIPLSRPLRNALYLTTTTCSVIAAALYPPTSLVILNYANAFLSVSYALRLVELLVINHPGQLRRLVKLRCDGTSTSPKYAWKPMPPALTFTRLLYVYDLLINPRGIGWAHGSRKYLPNLEKLNVKPAAYIQTEYSKQNDRQKGRYSRNLYAKLNGNRKEDSTEIYSLKEPQSRLSFLAKEATRLSISYMVYDAYGTCFGRHYDLLRINFHSFLNSPNLHQFELNHLGLILQISQEASATFVQRLLLPPACWAACYAFIAGIRAAVALFAVGGLYLVSPRLADDPWMYPPVFGPWQYIFWPKLKDIWGKLWHDLCRRALITSSTALVPQRTAIPLRRVLIGFLSFVISGVAHSAGTYAVSRDTHAVLMMMVFFFLLPVFITVQEVVSALILVRILPNGWIARVIIWTLDTVYILWWGYHTAPWFFRYSMIPEALASAPVPEKWSFWEII
ncbi:hypothetical protein BJX61DRAFT_520747 [Aspergillus egyptiacus]|nr:hypothetical protein BJX61DRAFT_520747 [Aspergillus egyptiacus]